MSKVNDLTYGEDVRGDHALFIERKHILNGGEDIDEEASKVTRKKGPVFFRVIENGVQQRSHGWIIDDKIVQWG